MTAVGSGGINRRSVGQLCAGLAHKPGDELVHDPRPFAQADQCTERIPAQLGHADRPVRRVGARVLLGHAAQHTRGHP